MKLALLSGAAAIAGYYGSSLLTKEHVPPGPLPATTSTTETTSFTHTASASRTTSVSRDWRISHLLRRASFGGSPEESSFYEKLGVNAAVDHLLNYEKIDDPYLATEPEITMSYVPRESVSQTINLAWWWIDRMVKTKRPLEEKLTLFWHNHFATANYKVNSHYLMYKQNQMLRKLATSKFRDILMSVTKDPAMLIWLDGRRNTKNAPNENYAREIMEIYTIGKENYSEDDVKAGARAFTGYTVDKNGNTVFDVKRYDDGTKKFLGQTGNFDAEDIVDILANHPATAANISRKLFEFLAYESPGQDVVDQLANVYMRTGGDMKAVVEAILNSEEFFSDRAYLDHVKSAVEFVVTALRSLHATASPFLTVTELQKMGQLPFNPPSVYGWPSGLGWINTSSMLHRYNLPVSAHLKLVDDESSFKADSVEAITRALLPDGLPAEIVQIIQRSTDRIADTAQKTMNAIRLTMATPYYNLN